MSNEINITLKVQLVLTGGELLLSIGVSLADPAADLAAYVTSLRDAGAVGHLRRGAASPGGLRRHLPACRASTTARSTRSTA